METNGPIQYLFAFFSAAIHRGQLLRARRTAPGNMSIDRMSGSTGRSGRAADCGRLDKELDLTVEAKRYRLLKRTQWENR
jgi:hypothetical protein